MIRLSEEDRLLLQNAANKAGFESIAAFVRSVARKEGTDKNSTEQDAILAEIRDYVRQILEKMDE